MRKFVSSLSLSGPVTPPMHGFGCAYQMPVCQAFLRGHQMTVIAKYIPNLSRIHSSLVISCRPECYPILRQWHMSGNPPYRALKIVEAITTSQNETSGKPGRCRLPG